MTAAFGFAPGLSAACAPARTGWMGGLVAVLRNLGPYMAVELILPGGSLLALLLWLYRRRQRLVALGSSGVSERLNTNSGGDKQPLSAAATARTAFRPGGRGLFLFLLRLWRFGNSALAIRT
jgi:hypothetical protein